MTINVDLITRVIIPIMGAFITYFLVPFIKAKRTQQEIDNAYSWVQKGVLAAEQMYRAGLIDTPRKAYVIDFLDAKGIGITIQELDIMIEAAVRELNIAQKKLTDK